MPLDLFSYAREAKRCFAVGRFLGTVVLASNLVEIVVNKDQRTTSASSLRRIKGWRSSIRETSLRWTPLARQ
jgi:hypothetical protein